MMKNIKCETLKVDITEIYEKVGRNMNIKPEEKTIKEILSGGLTYDIPRFQREYSWEESHYREFLEDMLKCLKIHDRKISTDDYFLGTMLFIKEPSAKYIKVVDGQQRLTTITILFSVLSAHFKELKDDVLSKNIFRYIMAEDDNGENVRVLRSKSHYPYFAYFIQDREKKHQISPNSEEENCIFETYNYFYETTKQENIKKLLKNFNNPIEIDDLDYKEILKSLRDQILQTIIVSITTSNKKQANMIFEILNAKGKHLANVDLIKNKIFEVISAEEPADYADLTWNEIKEKLYNSKSGVGFVTYFKHFWNSKYKKCSEKKLYDSFISEVKPRNEITYTNFLNELKKNVDWYIQIVDPVREYYDNRSEYFPLVQSLNVLSNYFGIVQSRIAILGLFDLKDRSKIKQKELINIIQYIEKFHFAYNAVCSKRSNTLEGIYSKFAIEIRKCNDKAEVKELIKNLLINKLEYLFPSYEEFEEKFINLTYSNKTPTPNNAKTKYAVYMLYGVEEGKDYVLFPEDGSIEHIIPESYDDYSNNIGNLIALEKTINNDCDNLNFQDKIKKYHDSKYECVSKFVNNNDDWTQEKIENRAKEMANKLYNEFLKNNNFF